MLYDYNTYKLILEKKRDNRDKIKKFINIPEVYNWSHDLEPKFSIWIANQIKNILMDYVDIKKSEIKQSVATKEVFGFIEEITEDKLKGDNINKLSEESKQWIKEKIGEIKNSNQYKFKEVIDWLTNPLNDEKINLSNYDIDEAYFDAVEWHKGLKATGSAIENETGTVIMTFPDGYYWIDLETSDCKEEGESMGHCATTDSDTIFSLRDHKKRPHVTVAYQNERTEANENGEEENYGFITQMKGKENTKPIEKYHPYIMELLKSPNVNDNIKLNKTYHIIGFENEYQPETDFELTDLNDEQLTEVIKKNEDIINNNSMKVLLNVFEKGLISKEKITSNYDDLTIKENDDGEIFFIVEMTKEDVARLFKDGQFNFVKDLLKGDGFKYFELNERTTISEIANFYWDRILDKTKKLMIEDIIGETITIEDEEIELTKNNVTLKNGNILISNGVDSYNLMEDIGEIEGLEDFEGKIMEVYTIEQEIANESEAMEHVFKAIESELGEFEFNDSDNIDIKLEFKTLKSIFDDDYANKLEYEYSDISSIISEIINRNDPLNVSEPQYSFVGEVKPEHFHESYLNV